MKKRRAQTASARSRNLEIRQEKVDFLDHNEEPKKKVSANSMIYAGLMNGSSVEKVAMTLDCCSVDHESITKAKSLLNDTEERSIQGANDSCQRARRAFSGHFATDTRWSGSKNGSEATTILIDEITGRILAFFNSIKYGKNKHLANYNGASNMMESNGLKHCLEIMSDDQMIELIQTVARDMDNKSGPILTDFGVDNSKERFDPGHYRKSFEARWKNFTQSNKSFEYVEDGEHFVIKQPYRGLRKHLLHWLNIVLKIENDDTRIIEWENFLYHIVGIHDFCHHGELEDSILWEVGQNNLPIYIKLVEFITKESKLIRKISTSHNSQRCESFNAELGRAIPKTFTNYHYNLNVCSQVIKHNEPNFYSDLLQIADAPKPQNVCWNRIVHYYDGRADYNQYRLTEEAKKRKNAMRRMSRAQNKSKPGDYQSSSEKAYD